jgi:sugar diacid utilization regulator
MPSPSQLEFFDLLGNFLAGRIKEELDRPALPDNMMDYFVFDLLEGRITNQALIQERLSYFRWDILEKGFAQIISIRWMDRDDQGGLGFRHLAETLLHTFPECRVFVYGLEIKLICPVSEPLERNPRFLEQLQSVLHGNQVSAGISRPLDQLVHIADFHLQAKKASEIGYRVEPDRLLHFFDNLSIYYALELACRKNPPDQFVHYGLVALRSYDSAHDTDLMKTLELYLEHDQSIAETAAALFIHRNTMNYRVSKIVELTNLDLKDPRVVDHLRFSFHVLRFAAYWQPEDPGISGEKSSI